MTEDQVAVVCMIVLVLWALIGAWLEIAEEKDAK